MLGEHNQSRIGNIGPGSLRDSLLTHALQGLTAFDSSDLLMERIIDTARMQAFNSDATSGPPNADVAYAHAGGATVVANRGIAMSLR